MRSGYSWHDVVRVYALNLLLIPVNLGGLLLSLRQAVMGRKPRFAPLARAGVVHHSDLDTVHLDDALPRQHLLERLLVHVSAYARDGWTELLQLLQELRRNEVSGV